MASIAAAPLPLFHLLRRLLRVNILTVSTHHPRRISMARPLCPRGPRILLEAGGRLACASPGDAALASGLSSPSSRERRPRDDWRTREPETPKVAATNL
ncbi:hypothetical protein MRX96_001365 [Rhipicephalus microplus]